MTAKNYYEKYWDEGGQCISEYIAFKQKIIKKISQDKLIFDYGGGDGRTVEFVQNRKNIFIGDISEKALEKARNKGFNTIILDENFQYDMLQKYDYILLLDCLEHMIDTEDVFKNIAQNLKKDAYVYISVPNMLNVFSRIYFLFGRYIDFSDRNHLTGELFSEHVQLFSRDKLEKLIFKYRLIVIDRYYFLPEYIESKNIISRFIWAIIYHLKPHNLLPSLFSLNFFYICKKP